MGMKGKILKFCKLWLPPILWAILIFKFSSGTIPTSTKIYWLNFTVNKIGHILLFGTLALLTYRAMVGEGMGRKKAAIWAIIVSLFYGATDEYHQMYTQGREAKVRDVIIDGIGASLIVYLVYKVLPRFPKKVQTFLLQFDIK